MNLSRQHIIHYILRIAVAMCFIGHGAFGIITKAVWCNYFAVFGISKSVAYQLMPVVGCIDILLGLIILIYPVRAIPAWLVIWGITTAMLRPLSGEPFAECIERAGNYGVPLSLLLLCGMPANKKDWFSLIKPGMQLNELNITRVKTCLKIVVFLLLAGHGWLNLLEKKSLLSQYASLGFDNPLHTAQAFGITEIIAAFLVLVKPLRPVLLVLFFWKVATELLYPNYATFEWIERGGSYGAILALWMATEKKPIVKHIAQSSFDEGQYAV